MKQKHNLDGLSVLALAVFGAFSSASAAQDPVVISGETEYAGPYKDVPVQIQESAVLKGTAGETEMEISGGMYEWYPRVLESHGTIQDAASLHVDGGTLNYGTITNIGTVTFENTYNKHSGGGLSDALDNNGTIEADRILISGRVDNKGTIKAGTFGSEDFSGPMTIDGGVLEVTGDAYFTELRIGSSDETPEVKIGGTAHISSAFRLQDAEAEVEVGNFVGSGYVGAEAGSIKVTGGIDIDQAVSARNAGSAVQVAGHVSASGIQVELGGAVSAASAEVGRIHAAGEDSSIAITGEAVTDFVQVDAGSALHVGTLSAKTGEVIDSFSNKGTVTLDNADLTVRVFTNEGNLNADQDGVSRLDQLTVTQGAWLTGNLAVKDFNASGNLTLNPETRLSVDKLGTADSAVQAVTIGEGSTIEATGDAYLNSSVSGEGELIVGGKANLVAGYQEMRTKMTVGSMEVFGFTGLMNTASLRVTDDFSVADGGVLTVETADLDIGKDFVLNGGAKVQMRNGSDGASIDRLLLNTDEESYFQVYRSASLGEVEVNGFGTIETYANGGNSSVRIGSLTVSEDSTVKLVNEGTLGDYSSTAEIGSAALGAGSALINSGGSCTVDEEEVETPPFEMLSIGSIDGNNAAIRNQKGGSMTIGTLSGSDNLIEVETVESGVTVERNVSTGLVYRTGSEDADKLGTQGALEAAAAMIRESDERFETQVADGLVNGGGSAAFDADGNMIFSTTGESLTMSALKQFSNATFVQWRSETNHLSERLGDVRRNLGAAGAWARIYGADSKVTDGVTTEVKTNTVQIGGDATVGGNWIVGGAFSYTNMDGDISNGSADGETYSLAAYASGFFNCGGYVDVIGRIGRISTDIDAYTTSGRLFDGSYDNTAFGLSVEAGYHWNFTPTFYVEPQAELSYGYVLGDDFTTSSGVKVEQDDFQSLVGRIGARLGANFPEKAGSFYLQASVNHEFLGDNDFDAAYQGYSKQHFDSQLDGTWVSYGVGLQINASGALSVYGSLSRANGDDYQDDYRYSVGMRYVF